MNKRWLIGLCLIIFLGGCGLMEEDRANMDEKELPDVPAFQDDFTREFMASREEVSDGYYLFESKTGGYTIPFLEDGRVDKIYYERTDENFEWVMYGGENEKITKTPYTIYLKYGNPSIPDDSEILLSSFENAVDYDGAYEQIDHDVFTHYYAHNNYALSDQQSSVYSFFGLVQSNDTNQYVRYQYQVLCEDEDGCDYNVEEIEQEVEKMVTSIEFNREEGGD